MRKAAKCFIVDKVRRNIRRGSSYERIFFKQMDECGGRYEISNKRHIRSNYGNMKILKPYQNRIKLYNEHKKRTWYNIDYLMDKYWNTHAKEKMAIIP